MTRLHLGTAAWAIFIAMSSMISVAAAGEIERYCIPTTYPYTTLPIKEAWPTAGPIRWIATTDPTGGTGSVVPGFPDASCGFTPLPGHGSLIQAAMQWNAVDPNIQLFSTPLTTPWVSLTPPGAPFNSMMFDVAGNDGKNIVTFHESAQYFLASGGAAALAVTAVDTFTSFPPTVATLNPTGVIDEVDIAFQVAGNFSWVDEDITNPRPWISNTVPMTAGSPPANFVFPATAYADIMGVAVHEFGHFLGLGHSLIESELTPSVNLYPSMFVPGQPDPITISVWGSTGCPSSISIFGWSQSTTSAGLGGMLGRNARTLEVDDKTALWEGYPDPGPWPYPGKGRILGQFNVQASGGAPFGFRGALITAVSATQPNDVRVSAITHETGNFEVAALDPGDYYLFAQRTEQYFPLAPAPGSPPDGYYGNFLSPNFVFLLASGCLRPAALMTPAVDEARWAFTPEYLSRPDVLGELSQQASMFHVSAGGSAVLTINADANPYAVTAGLQVKRTTSPNTRWSDRGLQLSLPTSDIEFKVGAGLNDTVVFLFGDSRTLSVLNNQLVEIAPLPSSPTPGTFSTPGPVPGWCCVQGPGPWQLSALPAPPGSPPILSARRFQNTLVQAIVWPYPTGSLPPYVSNVVNFWVTN